MIPSFNIAHRSVIPTVEEQGFSCCWIGLLLQFLQEKKMFIALTLFLTLIQNDSNSYQHYFHFNSDQATSRMALEKEKCKVASVLSSSRANEHPRTSDLSHFLFSLCNIFITPGCFITYLSVIIILESFQALITWYSGAIVVNNSKLEEFLHSEELNWVMPWDWVSPGWILLVFRLALPAPQKFAASFVYQRLQ